MRHSMRDFLLFSGILLVCACFAHGQAFVPTVTGTINGAGSTCARTVMDATSYGPSNCVSRQLPLNAAAAAVVLSGSFTATVQFEVSADDGNSWIAAGNSSSANTTTFPVSGYTHVRARASAYSGGPFSATITVGTGGVGGVPVTTVAGLASIPGKTKGTVASVYDGSAAGDCTTGGGTTAGVCQYSGSVWAAVTGSGSGVISVIIAGTVNQITASGTCTITSSGTCTLSLAPPPTTSGTSVSLATPYSIFVCTSTCTVTPPVPAAGYEFCVLNGDNVSTVITLAALGSSARYENAARTAYGTAGSGTFVSGGAVADSVCILGLDSTHYLTATSNGSWTAN